MKKSAQALFRPIHKTGLGADRAAPPQVADEDGRRGNAEAPARTKGLRTKKSPAASAFAAQPLGDSLKTRRPSPFCPCGAAPCLLTRQREARQELTG